VSELRCLKLAGAVRGMRSEQDDGRLKPVMTKNKGPESFLDVRGRAAGNGATRLSILRGRKARQNVLHCHS
jgi:hypothetical protein